MDWKTIVVGVDGSPESVRAAVMGHILAERTGAHCRLVHAAPDYWSSVQAAELGLDARELDRGTIEHARTLVEGALRNQVPNTLLADLQVAVGRVPAILADAARRDHADLLVLGGKHHRGLERITSSTIIHMVRAHDLPVLATNGGGSKITRILAAVDLSHAAAGVITEAERWAELFGAQLRVLHVVEPMPVVPGVNLQVSDDEIYRAAERLLDIEVWPLLRRPGAETVVRRGRTAAAIADEASQWHADLLVLGSHGKGWVDRMLLGSTSERLLHVMPVSMLVVPVGGPATAPALDLGMAWDRPGVARAAGEA